MEDYRWAVGVVAQVSLFPDYKELKRKEGNLSEQILMQWTGYKVLFSQSQKGLFTA